MFREIVDFIIVMKIINTSKNSTLAENANTAETYAEKAKGLIGARESRALFFETRWGIHTFGMKFPIDVVVFDEQNVVRALKENLKSNSYFFWNPRYKNVLELSAGTIKKTLTVISDTIKIL